VFYLIAKIKNIFESTNKNTKKYEENMQFIEDAARNTR